MCENARELSVALYRLRVNVLPGSFGFELPPKGSLGVIPIPSIPIPRLIIVVPGAGEIFGVGVGVKVGILVGVGVGVEIGGAS